MPPPTSASHRQVAIKMVRGTVGDPQSRERLWREARAAASVSHPNVCQLYDVGEANGELFIAMELLEGEPLSARLALGPIPLAESVDITLAILSALGAIHARGLVHRDLKPSNIFLTAHGVKLLDFGLARSFEEAGDQTHAGITMAGTVMGTPHYMSPEQINGDPLDARSDLFAAGAILFELLVGNAAFPGKTAPQVFHAIMYEPLPALGGSPALAAVDRVIHRATVKRLSDRYPDAAMMAEEIRAAVRLADSGETPAARTVTRLIVLPFRMLRPDPEIDFLSFSLADAITASLGSLESVVVRSSLAAARFKADAPDLAALASELDVNVAVTGTLLRAGTEVRVATQLDRGPERPAALVEDDAGDPQRHLSAPGRSHPPHRRIALAAALRARAANALARRAGDRPGLRVLPAAPTSWRLGSEELGDRARSLPAGDR